jgi:hypothetical protein
MIYLISVTFGRTVIVLRIFGAVRIDPVGTFSSHPGPLVLSEERMIEQCDKELVSENEKLFSILRRILEICVSFP